MSRANSDPYAGTVPIDRRILIVSIHYWPEETGIAPYTTGLADHLVSRGARVTVLTAMPFYPRWQVFEAYRGRLWHRERVHGVDVRRIRTYVPAKQSAARRALYEASFLSHALRLLSVPRPDLVVGVVPSLSGGVVAAAAATRFRVPLGLVFQDLSSPAAIQSGIPGGGRVARLTRGLEGWIARRATGVAIISEGFRPYLENLGVDAGRIRRVRNWTHIGAPIRTGHETRALLGWPANARICLHAGNMGLKQGLENVIECARLAQHSDPALLFVLMGDGNQRGYLNDLAKGLDNVRFLLPQPEESFPDVLAAADVLLVNQRPSVTDMSLPGKLTSYFAAGRPVVAAVAPTSETAAELRVAGAGVVVEAGAPEQLLGAIRRLDDDPSWAQDLGARGRAYAELHLGGGAALAQLEEFVVEAAGGGTGR